MSRTIAEIKAQILAEKANQPGLSGLTSTSQVSIFNLWAYVQAVAISIQEGLWDLFKTNLEAEIAKAPTGTETWLSDQIYKFQYDATTPQIIYLDSNYTPQYPVVNPNYRIITRASVKTLLSRIVSVKVAKSNPPVELTTQELNSLKGYLDTINFAGVQYIANSYPSDKLMVGATIYYDGQYSSTITADTTTAINNYLQTLPFDGFVKLSKLEDAIQSVVGVNDVVLNNIALRADSVPFSGTVYLLQNNTEIYRQYPMYSGYAVLENTSGHTITDTLTFVVD
jgi:hypothetical protein